MKRVTFILSVALIASFTRFAAAAETNHDFAKWEKAISAYERADKTNPPPKNALLFIGSSTIARWKTLAEDFPKQRVINRGFGGSQIVDSTHFADRLIFPHKPKMVFLRAGSNDIRAGKSAEEVFANYTNFVHTVHAKLPKTEIVFISLCPSVARWDQADKEKSLNKMVEEFIRGKPHLGYIESYGISLDADGKPRPELFVADKLHFNAEGYKLLVEKVRDYLAK